MARGKSQSGSIYRGRCMVALRATRRQILSCAQRRNYPPEPLSRGACTAGGGRASACPRPAIFEAQGGISDSGAFGLVGRSFGYHFHAGNHKRRDYEGHYLHCVRIWLLLNSQYVLENMATGRCISTAKRVINSTVPQATHTYAFPSF